MSTFTLLYFVSELCLFENATGFQFRTILVNLYLPGLSLLVCNSLVVIAGDLNPLSCSINYKVTFELGNIPLRTGKAATPSFGKHCVLGLRRRMLR